MNPSHSEVQGLRAYADITAVPEVPDLAVVAVAAEDAVAAIRDCAQRGVRAAMIFSAGFAEVDEEGRERQAEIVAAARQSGMRITGPNSLGCINVPAGVYATFTTAGEIHTEGGPIAIVSQSGGIGAMLYSVAIQTGLGVGYFCSTGNECDVTVSELLAFLVERPDVRVLLAFSESIKNASALLHAATRARELGKSIVYCKAGASEVGARAALSHTAALVGSDKAVAAIFEQYGILRADGLDDLLDWSRVLAFSPAPAGGRLAVVTVTGGGGVLVADAAAKHGLTVPNLTTAERSQLSTMLPGFASTANPIDTTAHVQSRPELLGDVLKSVAAGESTDMIALFLGALDPIADQIVAQVGDAVRVAGKPIIAIWGGGSRRYKNALNGRAVPTYDDHIRAVRSMAALVRAHGSAPSQLLPPPALNAQRRDGPAPSNPRRSHDLGRGSQQATAATLWASRR